MSSIESFRRAPARRGVRGGVVLLGLLLGLAASPSTASAGDGVPGADETLLFEEVAKVTAASRYEQYTREAPASITVVTAREIRERGYRSVADVLADARGFWISNDRNYSYVAARGVSVPGDYNSRILLLVDGHRLNDDTYGQALLGTEEVVDVDVIDRIEIVRGPTSSLYGTNAVLGIVNIVTRQGRWQSGARVRGETGSWAGRRVSGTWGTRTARGSEILLSGSAFRADGPDLYFPAFDDPSTSDGRAERLDGDRYQRLFGKANTGPWTVFGGSSSRRKTIPTGSYGTVFGDPDNWTEDARAWGVVRVEQELPHVSNFTASAAVDRYVYEGSYVYDDGMVLEDSEAHWLTLDAQADRFVGAHHLLVGGELRRDLDVTQVVRDADGIVLDVSRRERVGAVFAQDEFRLARAVRLCVGLRHDRYGTFGGTTNPRVAAVWLPADAVSLKLLYGSAFRAPTPFELDYNDGGETQKSPLSLRPERTRSAEAILEGRLPGGFHASASFFRLDLRDLVEAVVDPGDSLLVFANVGEVRSHGTELGLDWAGRGVRASAQLLLQTSRHPDTGERRANTPRHLAGARVSVPVGAHVRGGLRVRHVSAQETVFGDEAPAYTVGDLTLTSGWLDDRATLDVSVYNLFDASYGTPGGLEQAMSTIAQDRRAVWLRVGARF